MACGGATDTSWRSSPGAVSRARTLPSRPSVGISRVNTEDELEAALEAALAHDSLVLAEAAATGLEIECSVLGNGQPVASQPGEILLSGGEAEWYDYEAKYTPGGMQLIVPA